MRATLILALLFLTARAFAATFGDQSSYSGNFNLRDNIGLSPASPAQSGTCDSITVLLKFNIDSAKVRCALYTISGNDTVMVANSMTEEKRFATNVSYVWHGFAIPDPKPVVTAGAPYFIAVFGDTAGAAFGSLPRAAILVGTGTIPQRAYNYESGFPNPFNPSIGPVNAKLSAYVTYTPFPAASTNPRRRLIAVRPRPAP